MTSKTARKSTARGAITCYFTAAVNDKTTEDLRLLVIALAGQLAARLTLDDLLAWCAVLGIEE